jgi:hypothetical protein
MSTRVSICIKAYQDAYNNLLSAGNRIQGDALSKYLGQVLQIDPSSSQARKPGYVSEIQINYIIRVYATQTPRKDIKTDELSCNATFLIVLQG